MYQDRAATRAQAALDSLSNAKTELEKFARLAITQNNANTLIEGIENIEALFPFKLIPDVNTDDISEIIDTIKQETDYLRSKLNQWSADQNLDITTENQSFRDLLDKILLALSVVQPINLIDPITLEPIDDERAIFTKNGFVFDIYELTTWIKEKSKFTNPFNNDLFDEFDIELIKKISREKTGVDLVLEEKPIGPQDPTQLDRDAIEAALDNSEEWVYSSDDDNDETVEFLALSPTFNQRHHLFHQRSNTPSGSQESKPVNQYSSSPDCYYLMIEAARSHQNAATILQDPNLRTRLYDNNDLNTTLLALIAIAKSNPISAKLILESSTLREDLFRACESPILFSIILKDFAKSDPNTALLLLNSPLLRTLLINNEAIPQEKILDEIKNAHPNSNEIQILCDELTEQEVTPLLSMSHR